MLIPHSPFNRHLSSRSLIGWCAWALAISLLHPTAASAETAPVVRAVEVAGLNSADIAKAERLISTKPGEALNPEKTRQDLRALYDSGLFGPDLRVETENTGGGGVRLVYRGQPVASVSNIAISGNSIISNRQILGTIPMKKGDRATASRLERSRSAIETLYKNKGFVDIVVTVEEKAETDKSVTVKITVDEGSRTQVRSLRFVGNRAFSGQRLGFQIRSKGTLGPFKRYLNRTQFEDDLATLREFYGARGYLDAQITAESQPVAEDGSKVDLVVSIEEGPQYRIGRVAGTGYTVFSDEEIIGPFRRLESKTFSRLLFTGAMRSVRDRYGNQGFLAATIEPEFLRRTNEPGIVDVNIVVTEGPRIMVGEIKVVSETFAEDDDAGWIRRWYGKISPPVKDEVVRREVQLKPGQVYRRLDEIKTKDRLRGLGVFEQVEVRSQLTDSPSVRDAVVQVKEGNTGNLLFGVGFGDVEGGFGYVTYAEKNLFGLARDLRVSVLLGSSLNAWEISYLDRYFLGSDRSALFSVYQRIASRTGNLRQRSLGTSVEFTRPLDERLKESVRFRIESVGFTERSNSRAETGVRPEDYVAATLRYRLLADTRDTAFMPNEGVLAGAGVELGSAKDFLVKLDTRAQKWIPINDDLNYQLDLVAGFIPFDAENIGYAERFFMGGANDLRGFRVYGAGPHDTRNTKLPIGGSWKLLARQELRYRFTENLAAVGFFDAGTLSDKVLSVESPRASIGTGLRMRLPIATIGLDFGIPVLKQKQDQDQFFHFTLNSGI
jgi:outer membrane protein insertion porin family